MTPRRSRRTPGSSSRTRRPLGPSRPSPPRQPVPTARRGSGARRFRSSVRARPPQGRRMRGRRYCKRPPCRVSSAGGARMRLGGISGSGRPGGSNKNLARGLASGPSVPDYRRPSPGRCPSAPSPSTTPAIGLGEGGAQTRRLSAGFRAAHAALAGPQEELAIVARGAQARAARCARPRMRHSTSERTAAEACGRAYCGRDGTDVVEGICAHIGVYTLSCVTSLPDFRTNRPRHRAE